MTRFLPAADRVRREKNRERELDRRDREKEGVKEGSNICAARMKYRQFTPCMCVFVCVEWNEGAGNLED